MKYPVKKLKAPFTKTMLEEENEEKTDDKEVFDFDITEVKILIVFNLNFYFLGSNLWTYNTIK